MLHFTAGPKVFQDATLPRSGGLARPQVSISDFLTLFSSRTTGFFWSSRPGGLLLGAALFSLSLSTVLACAWPPVVVHPNLPVLGLARGGGHRWGALLVWIYCLVWCGASLAGHGVEV